MDHIGHQVKRLRLWRGLSQQQLADLTGWKKSAISMLETGARPLDSRQRLAQLAAALRVSPTDLTGEPYPLDAPGLAEAQAGIPALESALMETRIGDIAMTEPRTLDELAAVVRGPLNAARLKADDADKIAILPDLIAELQVYGREERALRLLAAACSEATYALRNLGQVPLAWIAAERAAEAAAAVGDPIIVAAAEFTRVHSRPTVGRGMARASDAADKVPTALVENDAKAQEVYGMLRLTAALAAHIRGDSTTADAEAAEAARVAEIHGERTDSWEYFGPANVNVWRTTLAVEAGQPKRALEYASTIDLASLPWPGRRAALFLDAARAHHQLGPGHLRQAIAALRQAERETPVRMRASSWARGLVEVMLVQSRKDTGSRELRGLAYRMGLDAG